LGTLRLRTIGRSSGKERPSMLFYLTDDPAYVVVATNAGANHDPAWWLNLQAQPRAEVDLPDGSLTVRGREAVQEERTRLWARVVAQPADYAGYAAAAGRHIVVLEPIEEEADA
jgi:deazaflavin-dependent oxidoreductase (nitroreductase family)